MPRMVMPLLLLLAGDEPTLGIIETAGRMSVTLPRAIYSPVMSEVLAGLCCWSTRACAGDDDGVEDRAAVGLRNRLGLRVRRGQRHGGRPVEAVRKAEPARNCASASSSARFPLTLDDCRPAVMELLYSTCTPLAAPKPARAVSKQAG